MKYLKNALAEPRGGATLVEVMIAVIILAVIVIGAGAMLSLSRGTISVQRNKHVALAKAIEIMERIQAETYANIRPPDPSPTIYTLDENLNINADTNYVWYVDINGIDRPISIAVERFNTTSPTNEFVRVNLELEYREVTEEKIEIESTLTTTL
ncbi:prepilin-type N-terminal cleavage/methylation domain-containing protein [Verrucomicrobiota bacterium]